MTITVVATIRAKQGEEEALKTILEGQVAPSRAEEGCVAYDLHQDVDEPTRFTFIEVWADEAALTKHFGQEHLASSRERRAPLLAGPAEVRKLTKIS